MKRFSSAPAPAAGAEPDFSALRDRLEQQGAWPAAYTFKFVVPAASRTLAIELLGDPQPGERPSRNGRYVGLTSRRTMADADAVIEVYRALAAVPGIISL